ncbi:hypothetical protein Vretimale_17844 [Volvox reticuliferus]|uniref:EF-hand domain-containing protein n=1 Tax=Volvox reticuliferus TaxID=1737510 RepID=A0A8J4FHI3_9CHLO|nr:hypothetical protein Vretifemale_1483 [Volvox reticuliferus]GIM15085.1 hypothetical protein Vretimale_17844 [Volvox reticuliferus]
MSGTMGDSTRARIAGAIRSANAGGGIASGDRAHGTYLGGYAGGMGGTWSKAPTNRGVDPMRAGEGAGGAGAGAGAGAAGGPGRPTSASRMRPPASGAAGGAPQPGNPSGGMTGQSQGQRERIRPASQGAKNAWDELPRKELPKAPPHGVTTKQIKPVSATLAGGKTTKPLTGIGMDFKSPGLGQMEAVGGALGSAARGGPGGGGRIGSGGVGGLFGDPAGPPGRNSRQGVSYNTGPVPIGRAAFAEREMGAAEQQMTDLRMSGTGGADLSDASMAMLEDQIRDALRARRTVYEDSKSVLLKMFKSVDDGSGDVSWEEFCSISSQLGVECSVAEAQRLFERFGFKDRLPYTRFANILLTQPSRQLAEEMAIRHGPFKDVMAANFHGKIKDKRCRKPLYTPTNWDPQVDGARSAELPNKRLVLNFVYGYNGKDATSQNLFYNAAGQVVYFTAGLAVVYTRRSGPPGPPATEGADAEPSSATGSDGGGHSQHFFLGHTDDVKALALCPAEVDVNGKKYPPRTIAATAQVSSHEEGPYICVWDSRVGSQQGEPQLARLSFRKEDRGFSALGFSPDGVYLAAVANDNSHTVYVYDWRRNRQDGAAKGQMGDPPQVYGIEWNPYAGRHAAVPAAFLTFGKKHIKMWARGDTGQWAAKQLTTGRLDMQNVHSAAWLPPRQEGGSECMVVAGMADGQLYLFKGTAAVKAIQAHAKGPQAIQPDGHVAYTGLRGMRLVEMRDPTTGAPSGKRVLLTGGADSTILRWDVSDGSVAEGRFAGPPLSLRSTLPDRGHCIRSIDYDPARGVVLVGTNQCDILEVTESQQTVLVYGHCDDVWAVAFHPSLSHRAATVSEKVLTLWDLGARTMDRCSMVGFAARAVAFSTKPLEADGVTHHLAVGGAKGDLMVFLDSNLQPVHKTKDSREGITDLKYSPDCRLLAAATADTWIDIYSVSKGYTRLQRCSGHSSTVRGIDWSTDGSVLQSDSADLELLVWNARTGKQIPIPSRDVQFATYTLRLGFPVMGIWPDGSDGTDVNAVARSRGGDVVATCDDDGLVKLFNCPCVLDDAPHRAYRGHSSHVLGVRFNSDDTMLVSVGGYDWAMFQFNVVELVPVDHGPYLPQKVWGALDPEGRSFGWTYTPHNVQPGTAGGGGGGAPLPPLPAPPGGVPPTHTMAPALQVGVGEGSGAGSRAEAEIHEQVEEEIDPGDNGSF